ncbi:MAG: 5-formyltetrahydrofolate cyclo-ligase [Gammaproteobacteria bacterium]|nr:5-formyltetrahydrofolate cyclo-ligase [Gammaproteobacteria bacterium]
MNLLTKSAVRSTILAKRRALTYDEIHHASQEACERLISTSLWQQSEHIAFYIAHDGEIDPTPLIDLATSQNKICYLPALATTDLKHLVIVRYELEDILIKNRYGIPEPLQDEHKIIAPEKLELVLVPLVAFDTTGTRLGMGVGYYDRTFAFLNEPNQTRHPQLVGFAYDFQQQDHLEGDAWDVRLDWIVTDEEIYHTQKSE